MNMTTKNEKKKVKNIMSSYNLVISLIGKREKTNFFNINFISEKSWEGLQNIYIIKKIITKKY